MPLTPGPLNNSLRNRSSALILKKRLGTLLYTVPFRQILTCIASIARDFKEPATRNRVFASPRLSRILIGVLSVSLFACADPPPLVPPTPLKSIEQQQRPANNWRKSVGDSDERRSGQFLPYVDDSGVYAASVDGNVVGYEADTGNLLWRRDLAVGLGSGVGGDAEHVYVASSEGVVHALEKTSGESAWTYAMPSAVLVRPVAAASTAQSEGIVVVRASNANIRGLNSKTGEELWSTNFDAPALTVHGYGEPVVLDSGVLVGLDDGKLAALSRATGALLWQSVLSLPSGRSEIERLVDVDANILVDDQFIYAVTYQGQLARVEPQRGNLIWSVPMSSVSGMTQDEEVIYLTAQDSEVVAVSKTDGSELWRIKSLRGRAVTRPALVAEGLLAVADFSGFVHVLDATNGSIIGRSQPLSSPPSSPSLVVYNPAAGPADSATQVYLQGFESELVSLRFAR